MEPIVIIQGFTLEHVLAKIENIVQKKFDEKFSQLNPSKKWHYMSRQEVAEHLKISLPTLHEWTKEGLLLSYKIGKRVLYRSDEVEESVIKRKFKRY
jgi:excisionase family DNA binding protein